MNCEQSNHYMMKYFDSQLSEVEDEGLKQHLSMCTKCSEGFNTLCSIFKALASGHYIEPPQDFEKKVMEKVHSYEKSRQKQVEVLFITLYAACAITLAFMVSMLLTPSFRELGIWETAKGYVQGIISNSPLLAVIYRFFENVYSFLAVSIEAAFRIFGLFFRAYYYISTLMAAVFLLALHMLRRNVKQGSKA